MSAHDYKKMNLTCATVFFFFFLRILVAFTLFYMKVEPTKMKHLYELLMESCVMHFFITTSSPGFACSTMFVRFRFNMKMMRD